MIASVGCRGENQRRQFRLVNDPFGDPALYVRLNQLRNALLFDCGDLSALPLGALLKISDVFVTHAHMDHFIGFDQLLRAQLNYDRHLQLWGPSGLIDHVAGRLHGYLWDRTPPAGPALVITANEWSTKQLRSATFAFHDGFAIRPPVTHPSAPMLRETPDDSVACMALPHGPSTSLAYSMQSADRIRINKAALSKMGWHPGPWLGAFKKALSEDKADEQRIDIPATCASGKARQMPLGELKKRIATVTPGTRMVYVADTQWSRKQEDRLVDFARKADLLFIEATFLHADQRLADQKGHLTARQAGRIAGRAGVGRFCIFHFSPRYRKFSLQLETEAQTACRQARGQPGRIDFDIG